jgi:hypothetical protein
MDKIEALEPTVALYQPNTLETGREYLLRIRQNNDHKLIFRPVKFVGYTPCPAVVIVSECDGWIQRISRVDLYESSLR